MSKTCNLHKVFKYGLYRLFSDIKWQPNGFGDLVEVDMPVGAEILSGREWNGAICIWALVEPNAETETRSFLMAGTGHEITGRRNLSFIDSVALVEPGLIFHIFEVHDV